MIKDAKATESRESIKKIEELRSINQIKIKRIAELETLLSEGEIKNFSNGRLAKNLQ